MGEVDQERLVEIATKTRAQLEPVWQQDPNRLLWQGTPLSYGQCDKDRSIWHVLAGLKNEGVRGMDELVRRHMGRLMFDRRHGVKPICPHQWLQVGQVVMDITADQSGLATAKVVCATPKELDDMGLSYQPYHTWNTWCEKGRWDEIQITTRSPDGANLTSELFPAMHDPQYMLVPRASD